MSDMTNRQLLGLNDENFLEAMREHRPEAFAATEAGHNLCPCETCSRLRPLLEARDAARIHPLPMSGVERMFNNIFGPGFFDATNTLTGGQDFGSAFPAIDMDAVIGRYMDIMEDQGLIKPHWRRYPQIDTAKSPQDYEVGFRGFDNYGRLFEVVREQSRFAPKGHFTTFWKEVPAGEPELEPWAISGAPGCADDPAIVALFEKLGFRPYNVNETDPIEAVEFDSAPMNRLPEESEARKAIPLTTGVLDYFPDALAAVAFVSKFGNDKHNPGEPLHHARGKSTDHADCISRHLVDRGGHDKHGIRHSAYLAWRALALLQEEIEADRDLPLPRGASPA